MRTTEPRRHISLKRLTALLAILGSAAVFVGCAGEQDRAQANTVAARVHAHLRAAEFAEIYNESAPRFKTVGSESEFVSRMKTFHEGLGLLKNANVIAYETGLDSTIGRTHVLIFKLEYEHGKASERLTLVRSATGEMQLWKMDIEPVE